MRDRDRSPRGVQVGDGRDSVGRLEGVRESDGRPALALVVHDGDAEQELLRLFSGAGAVRLIAAAFAVGTPGLVGRNAVQQVVVTGATGGTFTLAVGSDETDAIDHAAVEADIQSALDDAIGASKCVVSGDAPDFTVTFIGTEGAKAVAAMVADGASLTPAAASVEVVVLAPGNAAEGIHLADLKAGDLIHGLYVLVGTAFDGTSPTLEVTLGSEDLVSPVSVSSAGSESPTGFAAFTAVSGSTGVVLADAELRMLMPGAPANTKGAGVAYVLVGSGLGDAITVEAGA